MEAIRRARPDPPPKNRGFAGNPVSLGVGVTLLAALVGGMAGCFLIPRGSDVERGMKALVDAFSQRRLVEPRLSGGFKAGRFNPDQSDTTGVNNDKLGKARDLLADAAQSGDAPSQLAYGRLLLLDGKGALALRRIRFEKKI